MEVKGTVESLLSVLKITGGEEGEWKAEKETTSPDVDGLDYKGGGRKDLLLSRRKIKKGNARSLFSIREVGTKRRKRKKVRG